MNAAVLQVGQISFELETGTSVDDRALVVGGETAPGLCAACKLLSCSPADLQGVLETRQISARMETYTVNLRKSEAEAARDALGKALYDRYACASYCFVHHTVKLTCVHAIGYSLGWLVVSTCLPPQRRQQMSPQP